MPHDLQQKVIVVTYLFAFGFNGLVFRAANQKCAYLARARAVHRLFSLAFQPWAVKRCPD